MKIPLTRFWLLFLLPSLIFSEDNFSVSNILQQTGNTLLNSIVDANYREIPIDELFSTEFMALPQIVLSKNCPHPVLLFNQQQLSMTKKRTYQAPYHEWAEWIINASYSEFKDPASPLLTELERSTIAKRQAFIFILTGQKDALTQAQLALDNIQPPDPIHSVEGGKAGQGWGDWLEAGDALMHYAVAYDLLYFSLSDLERKTIESLLGQQISQIIHRIHWIPKNNHAIAIGCGIGTAALVLEHKDRQHWINQSINLISSGLHMIETDGSYREGAYYGRYIASRLYPFFVYLHNRTGYNLFEHRSIQKFNRWLIDIQKPDASVPLFDDAFPENFLYQPMAVGLSPQSHEIRYIFEQHQERFNPDNPFWIDAYCSFDHRIHSQKPAYLSAEFYPEGGFGIFRNSDTIYGLFIGERGRPFLSGHDHIEPGAFTLSAFGEDLLIDAGYAPGGTLDKNRPYFISGKGHNMPLINGLGPNQNPVSGDQLGGQLNHNFRTEHIASSTVQMQYRDVDMKRQIWFIGQRYFLVQDNFIGSSKNHITIPWHGNGQFTRTSPNKGYWQNNQVTLNTEIIAQHPVQLTTQTGHHTGRGETREHDILNIHLHQAERQDINTFFAPQSFANNIEIIPVSIHSQGYSNARRITSINEDFEDFFIQAENAWQLSNYESDAKTSLIHEDILSGMITFMVQEASYFKVAGEMIFESDDPIDITIALDPQGWYGYLNHDHFKWDQKTKTRIKFYTPANPELIYFNRRLLKTEWIDNTLILHINQSGNFELGQLRFHPRDRMAYKHPFPLLNQLSHSSNPNHRLYHMTQGEAIQLRNEIIYSMGTAGIQITDSLLHQDKGIQKLYGTLCGIANHAYNNSGVKPWAIPQRFYFSEHIKGHRVEYHEEGLYSAKGIESHFHTLSIDDNFQYQLDHVFKDQQSHTIFLNWRDYQTTTHVESFNKKINYSLDFTHHHDSGFIQYSHAGSEANRSQNNTFSCLSGAWSAEANYNASASELNSGYLLGQYRSSKYTSSIQSRFEESSGFTSFDIFQSYKMNSHFLMDAMLQPRYNLSENQWNLPWQGHTYLNVAGIYGGITYRDFADGRQNASWRFISQKGKIRLISKGYWKDILRSDWGIAFRQKRLSSEVTINRHQEVQTRLVCQPSLSWRTTGQYAVNYQNGQTHSAGAGLFYSGSFECGSEILYQKEMLDDYYHFTGILGFPIGAMEYIHLFANGILDSHGEFDTYEIQILQSGKTKTPGIFISKDRRGDYRFEGYLMWMF